MVVQLNSIKAKFFQVFAWLKPGSLEPGISRQLAEFIDVRVQFLGGGNRFRIESSVIEFLEVSA
jgi:hypothetical protein